MGDKYTNPPQSRNEAILRATIDGTEYTAPPQSRIEDLLIELKGAIESGSVSSYTDLTDKPSINGVTLTGDKTTQDLKILDGSVPYLLSDVSDVLVVADGQDVTITWTDPIDIVDGETVITAWAGTKVVRKVGSAPDNVYDGDLVVDSKTRNQYSTNGYVDENLSVATYYYRFFPYSENGVYTTGQSASATTREVIIYGAEWDGTSTAALTRTDKAVNFVDPNPYYSGMSGTPSSPFDNILPWSGIERVTDATAGELVKIPKFYYKITRNGSGIKFQISATQERGFKCSPAHMDRGDGQGERDFVYIGRYHSYKDNVKSRTGVTPPQNSGYSFSTDFLSHAHIDTDVWIADFALFSTIQLLYIVEFANWDKAKVGYGCSPNNQNFQMGYTDSMPYHTGTTATSRTSYGGTQYRYIEGLWDNMRDFVGGFCSPANEENTASDIKICLNPADFADVSKYESIGYSISAAVNGCVTEFANPSNNKYDWVLYGKSGTGQSNYDVYTGHYMHEVNYKRKGSNSLGLSIGSNYVNSSSGRGYTLFSTTRDFSFSYYVGFRLMKLPANS